MQYTMMKVYLKDLDGRKKGILEANQIAVDISKFLYFTHHKKNRINWSRIWSDENVH